jgi:hypothetical protein
MKDGITFRQRKIADGFTATLHNIYYYTGRWGLSVRSFTGEHWKYWEALPGKLREAQASPQALAMIIHELEGLALKSEERRIRRESLVRDGGFCKKEVVINEQVLAILAALPHPLLSAAFRSLTFQGALPEEGKLVERELPTGEQLIEPDFLILGGRQLLMGELKVKADSRTGDTKYDANQLYNYLSLAVKCLSEDRNDMPNRFSHIILVPSVEPRWFVRGQLWITDLQAGPDRHMQFNIETTHQLAQKSKSQQYITDVLRLGEVITDIPVYCRSYFDLADALERVICGYPLESHWRRIYGELWDLAQLATAGL